MVAEGALIFFCLKLSLSSIILVPHWIFFSSFHVKKNPYALDVVSNPTKIIFEYRYCFPGARFFGRE